MILRKMVLFYSVLLAFILSSCITGMAVMNKKGLRYTKYDLSIEFNDAKRKTFINSNWLVDNWSYKNNSWKQKDGNGYSGSVERDLDENGSIETYIEFYSELKLKHKKKDARPESFQHTRKNISEQPEHSYC